MKVFTEKIGGKYCPSFTFGNQTFHLRGFDTKEEAAFIEQHLKVCFSNYGLMIVKNYQNKLVAGLWESFKSIF